MNFSQLFSRLEKSKVYKDFKENNKNAFFCAGFFILNFKNSIYEYSLDLRDEIKLYTFKISLTEDVKLLVEDIIQNQKPLEQIQESDVRRIQLDIDKLKDLSEEEIWNNKITTPLNEIIAVLQCQNNKLIWNLTCMCEGFVIINMQFDPFTTKLIKFEKKNLMDFVSMKKPEKK